MTPSENEQIQSLNTKVDRILNFLENDPSTGEKGLVARTKDLEKKIGQIETDEKVKRGKTTVLTIVGSALISFLAWLFK